MRFRNTLFLLLAVAGITTISSCTKKYTCQCKIIYSGQPGLPDSSITEYDVYNTKAGAKSICEDESYEHVEDGIRVKETCTLY